MRTIIFLILFGWSAVGIAQDSFDKYFTNKVLRFYFMLSGNNPKGYCSVCRKAIEEKIGFYIK